MQDVSIPKSNQGKSGSDLDVDESNTPKQAGPDNLPIAPETQAAPSPGEAQSVSDAVVTRIPPSHQLTDSVKLQEELDQANRKLKEIEDQINTDQGQLDSETEKLINSLYEDGDPLHKLFKQNPTIESQVDQLPTTDQVQFLVQLSQLISALPNEPNKIKLTNLLKPVAGFQKTAIGIENLKRERDIVTRWIANRSDTLKHYGAYRWSILNYDQLGGDIDPCFAPGTVVKTPNGDRKIEDLAVGDFVLAYDQSQHEVIEQPILQIIKNWTLHLVEIDLEGKKIRATRQHPFWVNYLQQWLPASDLKAGVHLLSSELKLLPIQAVASNVTFSITYNLEIAIMHTYILHQYRCTAFRRVQSMREKGVK